MNETQIHALKAKLRRTAAQKFPGDEKRQNAYIWGTIQKIKESNHARHQT